MIKQQAVILESDFKEEYINEVEPCKESVIKGYIDSVETSYETAVDIEGYEGLYKISINGNVINVKKNRAKDILNTSVWDGFVRVTLYDKNGNKQIVSLKKLVYDAFGKYKTKFRESIYHIDGDVLNCKFENLFTGKDISNIIKKYKQ